MFNAPKQNCMRNLERFRQSSILSKKRTALFPPKPSVNNMQICLGLDLTYDHFIAIKICIQIKDMQDPQMLVAISLWL